VISIDVLPDDVLLPIFHSYLGDEDLDPEELALAWQSLVHVCRRWRSVVLGSPRRLDLRIFCTRSTRSRDMLDIWPPLPLIIKGIDYYRTGSVGNVVAALKCSDRVCQIFLMISNTLNWEKYLAVMQQPFLELTDLRLWSTAGIEMVVVLDSFLGGFAPRLEDLWLEGVPFPGLPKLLLSTTHLVDLHLIDIPHSGYFSPDAMVATLSTLTNLKKLSLRFKSPESCPDLETRRLPPSTRFVLPVLTSFQFMGVSEYLEDLVTDINAFQLNELEITLFNDIVFDIPQLIQFISRTPMSSTLENAHISLMAGAACISFRPQIHGHVKLEVPILCEGLDWQLSSLEQVCTSCLPFLPTLGDLYINEYASSEPDWKDSIGNGPWLELLRPFTAMKNLYISKKIALRIGPALQEHVEGRTTEVFPTLENIFLEGFKPSGPVDRNIGHFVAAREVVGHHIAISGWADPRKGDTYW